MKNTNRSNQTHFVFILMLFTLIIFLTGCKSACVKSDISNYIDEIIKIHSAFTEYTNQSLNHPELESANLEQMNAMMNEFSQLEPPTCAEELSEKTLKAMQASITFLAPSQDVFYYPYQLAKFALDDWQAVDDAIVKLIEEQEN